MLERSASQYYLHSDLISERSTVIPMLEKFLLKLSTMESRVNLSLIEITPGFKFGPPLKIKFLKNPGAEILYIFLK